VSREIQVVNPSIQLMLFRALFLNSKSNCEHTQNSEMVKYCITTFVSPSGVIRRNSFSKFWRNLSQSNAPSQRQSISDKITLGEHELKLEKDNSKPSSHGQNYAHQNLLANLLSIMLSW